MINILSIRCSLSFVPYLVQGAAEFIREGRLASRVVRQGGSGLIIRSNGEVVLRHENRQATLSPDDVRHYFETVQHRGEVYDVLRMQDEVVLANVGNELLLSHPQSELWLGSEAVAALANAFNSQLSSKTDVVKEALPEWLSVSLGGGRLLLSDQRTARWVLLGADHIRELERRLEALTIATEPAVRVEPPTIPLKGVTVHLQSAFKLAETLEEFANTGNFEPFVEITPDYSLTASRSTEGVELTDSNNRVALTQRESRKWAGIIRGELDRFNAIQFERGGIRTVCAASEQGQWVLQWGDEVFLPSGNSPKSLPVSGSGLGGAVGSPIIKHAGGFVLLLRPETGSCVALTDAESGSLEGS